MHHAGHVNHHSGWLVIANRVVGTGLIGLGIATAGVGFYLGAFGWLNDGPAAGVALMLIPAGFGMAFLAAGVSFRVIARAHATRSPARWWLQLLLPITGFVAFGLAATFSSFMDDLLR